MGSDLEIRSESRGDEDECGKACCSLNSAQDAAPISGGCCSPPGIATTLDSDLEICSNAEDACTKGCCSTPAAITAPDSNICCDHEDECCSPAVGRPSSDSSDNKDKAETACQRACCSSPMEETKRSEDDCSCCGEDEDVDICEMGASLEIKDVVIGDNYVDIDDGDDDSVCPCCIAILMQHPEVIGQTLAEAKSDRALFPENSAHRFSATVRRCCRLFESVCAQRPCCMPLPRPSKKPIFPVAALSSCKQPEEQIPTEHVLDNLTRSPPGEPLKLEITGMDCADCCIKVTRALLRLPSVKPVHLDYLEAVASLLYDPEVITPEGISRYVARSTSFGIKAIGKEDARPSNHLTLPVTFSNAPPAHVLEKYNARHRNELHGFTEISFPVRGDGARQPRQVLAELADYGPQLLPVEAVARVDDRVAQDLRRTALRTLLISILAIPVLVLAWAPLPERPIAYGVVSVVFTTLIQLAAFPILSSSVRSIIFLRTADMSVLVSISTISAWIFSIVSFAFEVVGKPFAAPFFETAALLVALIYVGRLVQALTRRAASSAVRALQQLQPSTVILVEQVGRSMIEEELDARLLHYGDVIRLGPATRIPTDGMVVAGSSSVDESSVTGESVPRLKQVGGSLTAGTFNLTGALDMQVTQLIHENSLARIAGLVRQASATRSRFQDIADRFAAGILPISTACAGIAFIVWFLVNHYAWHLSSTTSAVSALTYALAVLVVSCPCAIGIAVPLIVATALRAGRGEGVLFRSSEALQRAYNVGVIVFDKTGTLSRGIFSLERTEILAHGVDKIIVPLTSTNEHPISKAILAHFSVDPKRPPWTSRPNGIISLPGMGVKTSLAGYPLLGGSAQFTGSVQHPLVQELTSIGLTLFTVTLAGELVAAFGLADRPRPDAPALLAELALRGKRVLLLSGDNPGAVSRFAAQLQLQPGDVEAACAPADKAAFVKTLQESGQRVCFVGDGTNDAPALAQADVALCVAAGADVAVAAAGALVAGENLQRGVLAALDVATHAHQHMLLALGWCVMYNVAALLFASGAFVRVRIEPRWAGLGELVSVVPVVMVGLALDLRWRWRRRSNGHRN